jgi:hypothetical protein
MKKVYLKKIPWTSHEHKVCMSVNGEECYFRHRNCDKYPCVEPPIVYIEVATKYSCPIDKAV